MRILALALALTLPLVAQISTGTISGTVVDSSGLPAPAVQVTLTQPATGLSRQNTSGPDGGFQFTSLGAGEYALEFYREGFKRSRISNVNLVSGDRLALGDQKLEIGAPNESVTVRSDPAQVQTESAERASVITSSQIDGLLIQSRNPTSLVGLLPGVVVTQETKSLDRDTTFNVMGNRRTSNNVAIDGVPTVDLDNGFSQKLQVNMDAVSEVQVLLSNYQAEYGRNAGSNVNIITKSGTREFHGAGSYFKRHEQFNANNYFNNFRAVPKPRVRYNTWTYNIGGPVRLPGFNKSRDKLFFFFSQEFWPISEGVTRSVTVPTAPEREGDFSQSRDVNNVQIVVRDPLSGAAFPGNRIPANRLNASGLALLKVFDQPNFFDRNISRGNYNYVFTSDNNSPKRSELLKVDWNINPNNLLYVTYTGFNEVSEGSVGSTGTSANWPQIRMRFGAPNKGLSGRYTRILSPNAVNEVQVGWLRNPEKHTYEEPELARNQRAAVGFVAGQLNAANNPLGIIPNATFGGVPTAATLAVNGRFPADNRYDVLNIVEKFSLTRGRHSMKFGAYWEWARRDVNQAVAFNGSIDFGRNANNPLDTNYAYANAALGIFNSYTEPSSRPRLFGRSRQLEWFAQDNWKVTSRLTLDVGIRFYWMPPIYDDQNQIAGFGAGLFDPAKRVSLISPALNAQNQRIGINPVTGQTYSAQLIGAIAPNTGDPSNGLVVGGTKGFPGALMNDRGIHYAPRFGFALDPFGNGKTAVRGGIGMFYNRLNANVVLPLTAQAPLVQNPVINFGELSSLRSAGSLLYPTNVVGLDREGKVPTVINYSFSIQRKIGYGIVVDAGYVGSLGRHLYWTRDLNPIPAGANFRAANFDSTLTGGRPLPPAFLRPLIGMNSVSITEPASSSNYHSLQVTANRRFRKDLQLGAAWTWSKAMDYNSTDQEAVSSLVPVRIWNYGTASFDRTHVVKLNWLYNLPSSPWRKGPASLLLNGWQVTGIASFVSGAPLSVGFATVNAVDITGTASQGARIQVLGNPVLPKSDRTFYQAFRTDVFALPATGTFGNAPRFSIRGPGINNFDVSFVRNIPLRENIRLQFRAEMYNLFNHTQFDGVDTTARFDNAGKQVNAQFGQYTSARDARLIQLALRLYF